jgi:photosystem II stability/assembly factor-like uncharacterized protein
MKMRRQIVSLIFCVLLLAGSALAARTWTVQVDTTEATLNGVSFTSFNNGRAVGNGGVILKTTDAGRTWTSEASGTADNLNALFLLSSTEGWAVGNTRRVVHLSGGAWTASQIPYAFDFDVTSVCLTGTSTIFASGGPNFSGGIADFRNIFYSQDGGGTWTGVKAAGAGDGASSFNILQAIFFINSQVGYACGQNDDSQTGKIFRTTDEGASWVDVSPPSAANIVFNDIAFINTSEGWAVGTDAAPPRTGYVYHTQDGGDSWDVQFTSSPDGFRRLSVASTSDAWVVSDQSKIYRYDGATWDNKELALISSKFFTAANFVDKYNGWAVGGLVTGGPQRIIYKYVVDPFELTVTPSLIYITTATFDATVAVSGNNIESDATLTVEAASGLVLKSYSVAFDPILARNKINATLTVDPTAAAGSYRLFLANPTDGTNGSAAFTAVKSTSPVTKPSAVPLPEKIFNPSVDSSVAIQVATPPDTSGAGALSLKKSRARAMTVGSYDSVKDVDLELIVYSMTTNQIAFRKKFRADPSGFETITLAKVTDLGFTLSQGVWQVIIVHPGFGKIGSGQFIVDFNQK